MSRMFWCGLLIGVLHTAHAATFDLGRSGRLSIDLPPSWVTSGRELENHCFDLRFQPTADEGPQICFTVIVPPDGKALDRAEASQAFREVAAQFAMDSASKEAAVTEKKLADGFAFYASFTNSGPADQASAAESWKHSTPCVMVLGGRIVVSATIFSDDLAATDFSKSLDVLWSARLDPRE